MCNLGLVTSLLIAGQVAYVACLVLLAIGILNSASFFAAAANVPLMVAAIVLAAVATASFGAALVELDRCAAGACGSQLQSMRDVLLALLADMAAFTVGLVALAIVAAVPFAGAVAIGAFIAWAINLTVFISAIIDVTFAERIKAFNACQAAAGAEGIGAGAVVLTYIGAVAAAAWSIGLGLAGKVPWWLKFEF